MSKKRIKCSVVCISYKDACSRFQNKEQVDMALERYGPYVQAMNGDGSTSLYKIIDAPSKH